MIVTIGKLEVSPNPPMHALCIIHSYPPVHATYPFLPKPPFLPVYSQVFLVCQVMLTVPWICQRNGLIVALCLCLEWLSRNSAYIKMSNNVLDKIKPFGTLRDLGAGHFGHYDTFLYGHGLGPFRTLRDFFLGHYKTLSKIFLQALCALPPLKLPNFCFAPPPLLEG